MNKVRESFERYFARFLNGSGSWNLTINDWLKEFDNMELVPIEKKRQAFPEFDEKTMVISGATFKSLPDRVEKLEKELMRLARGVR